MTSSVTHVELESIALKKKRPMSASGKSNQLEKIRVLNKTSSFQYAPDK